MQFNRNDLEILLDLNDGFQAITLLNTGKLTIDMENQDKERCSMTIHFPSLEDANNWVNHFFTEFAAVNSNKQIQ